MLDKFAQGHGIASLFSVSGVVILFTTTCFSFLLVWWLAPHLKRYMTRRYIRSCVKRLGSKTLHNVKLPDGVDGEIHLDHLVLSGDKVIIVDVKHYDGLIYGAETLQKWTQVVNSKNFEFTNPLLRMHDYVIAVQSIVPGLKAEGIVLFAGRSRFPKRIPEGVLKIEDLPRRAHKTIVSEQTLLDWERLHSFQQDN